MTYEEAVDVLQAITEVYPKPEISKRKAKLLIPRLQEMDYHGVMHNLSIHAVSNSFAPTIAEIASYPIEENLHLEEMKRWQEEAAKVPEEIKEEFRRALDKLVKEKSR